MTNWKELCQELRDHLALLDEPPHELVCRAQEALAQPEPDVEPTVSELQQVFDDYSDYVFTDDAPVMWATDFHRAAKYVLARWGNHFPDATKMVSPATAPRNSRSSHP